MKNMDLQEIASAKINWNRFAKKTVLITGANGFLPAYMVDTLMYLNNKILKKAKCKVIALVRNKKHAEERFAKYTADSNFILKIHDVSNIIDIDEKIDFIVHAASPASPKYYKDDPIGVILPNVFGTKNSLELAVKNKVESYLYFSSGEIYGEPTNNNSISEDSYGYVNPLSIRSCYAESKKMGENLCIAYGHQCNVPVKIVRPFHTYGPGMKLDDGRVFADFVKNVVNNEDIELKSDGSACRPFCYLSDATIAFFQILLKGENNNAYNVSNPYQIVSIKDLATILVSLFPEKRLKVITARENENYLQSPIKIQVPDISKIKNLGWEPTTDIKTGFTKTIESYL
jgi:nucleoside-diphosphate-sugar epimerase